MNLIRLQIFLASLLFTTLAIGNVVSVMTYNMENLFDNVHNEGVEDYAYLPLSVKQSSKEVQAFCQAMRNGFYREQCFTKDWNDKVVATKLKNLAQVVRGAVSGGPDVLVLQEVENQNILRMLIEQELYDLGYKEIHITTGPDPRGINVAIVSRLPLIGTPKFHPIDLRDAYPGKEPKLTRGILEATFRVGDKPVTFLSNHWSSQSNPDITRVMAAKVMIKAVKESRYPVISGGDFNTVDSDSPHAINQELLNPKLSYGFVAIERPEMELSEGRERLKLGTHFYRGEWSLLDRFFVAKSHLCQSAKQSNCLVPDYASYKIYQHPDMVRETRYQGRTFQGVPFYYDDKTGEGASDHLPVVVSFEVR